MNWPSSTNRGTALLKYLHQQDRPLLVHDDFVGWFVEESAAGPPPAPSDLEGTPESQMAFIAYRYSALRERFFDELIEVAVGRGATQLLLLGAGFDTRCLRLDALRRAAVRVVEVDRPETIAAKREILAEHLGSLPANLVLAALDLAIEELDSLFDLGLLRELPTACIWQGVSYYLTAEEVSRVLDFMVKSLPPGTVIGFDACAPQMLDESSPLPAARFNVRRLRAIGEPYRFGVPMREMRARLAGKGFRDVEIVDQRELEGRYLHSSLLPADMWYAISART